MFSRKFSFRSTARVAAAGWFAWWLLGGLKVFGAAPPVNDNFSARLPLFGANVTVTANSAGATVEPTEPSHATFNSPSLWWTWTAPRSGTVFVSSAGSSFMNTVDVYSGASLLSLVSVPARLEAIQPAQYGSQVTFSAVAGSSYEIAVSGRNSYDWGDVVLSILTVDAPANDNFAAATDVSGTKISATGSNYNATQERGEPKHGLTPNGPTVWWRWTPAASGSAIVSTIGSDYETVLAVYTGNSVASLQRVAGSLNDHHSPVMFAAVSGTTYSIAVDGDNGLWGNITLNLELCPSPPNDDFADRLTLTGSTATGSTRSATHETGEPAHEGVSGASSVWWRWIAPATGAARLSVEEADSFQILDVYTGSTLATLALAYNATAGTGASQFEFPAIAGTDYQIAVSSVYPGLSDFRLTLAHGEGPPNDMFAARAVLTGGSVVASGNTVHATHEAGEPMGRTLWWTWTAPSSGVVAVSTAGSSFDAVAGIFTGSSVETLNAVERSQGNSGESSAVLYFPAVAGQTYQIAVAGRYGQVGDVLLHLDLVPVPSNDTFAARASLAGANVTDIRSSVAATREAGEPAHGGFGGVASLWWTWTAPTSGTVIATTDGSDFDTMLAAYTGTALATLTPVAANLNNPVGGTASRIVFSAVAGTTYLFAVDGENARWGLVKLNLSLLSPPTNDRFASRRLVTGASVSEVGSNVGASAEPTIEAYHDVNPVVSSVWWSWTAPTDGAAVISTAGSSFDTVIAIYTGSVPAPLERRASNDNAASGTTSSRTELRVAAGTTYQIAVDGRHGATGDIALTITMASRPTNDQFVDRQVLNGSSLSITGNNFGATDEVQEPSYSGGYPANASVWYSWTAPTTGTATVRVTAGDGHPLGIYTGSTLAALRPVTGGAELGDVIRRTFHVDAGVAYHIAIDSSDNHPGSPFTFTIEFALAPSNDFFASRASITGTSSVVSGSNRHATAELNEVGMGPSPGRSTWWTWTAPANGRLVLLVESYNFAPVLTIYTGAVVDALTPRAVDADVFYTGYAFVSLDVVAGTSYQIAVDAMIAQGGEYFLSLLLTDPPANDDFADRIPLTGNSARFTGNNIGASSEPGEKHVDVLWYWEISSVWWTWTAPVSGRCIITAYDANFPLAIAVYTGSTVDDLTRVAWGYDYNHDGFALWEAVAGTTYQIRVMGSYGDQGDFDLHLRLIDPPVNDEFVNRTVLTASQISVTADTTGATQGPGEGMAFINAVGMVPSGASLWWSWIPPFSGTAFISTTGSSFDTGLILFRGTDPNVIFNYLVDFNDDDPRGGTTASRVKVVAFAGVPLEIVVDGHFSQHGPMQLNIDLEQIAAVSLDLSSFNPVAGQDFELRGAATGVGPYSYQWTYNGDDIPGATGTTLRLIAAQGYQSGLYALRVTTPYGSNSSFGVPVAFADPPPSGARLTNLSTRAVALTGDNVLIPGFVIAGPGNKKLLIRAVGPTLGTFGVPGVLPNPRLQLKRYNGTGYDDVTSNDDWGTNANAAAIITKSAELFAFPLDAGSADAALLVDLAPGQYSVVAGDPVGASGVALVELYDADPATGTARLINISNRGYVGAGDAIMIPGFVVSEEGPKTLLIRVVGPTLGTFGVPDVLADPTLSIYRKDFVNNTDDLILTNDDWSTGPGAQRTRDVAAQVFAFALPEGSKDAAFVVTLNPGVYTVHARGKDDTEGVALVEVYAVP